MGNKNPMHGGISPGLHPEYVAIACALIKAADDAAADNDYMLDSDDCISVLRGTWAGPMLNDHPRKEATSLAEDSSAATNLVAEPNDTALLDWVEAQGNGQPWVARQSMTGRGFRVHNDHAGKHPTVRAAIIGAMSDPAGINGLTEAETSRTASVMGLVGKAPALANTAPAATETVAAIPGVGVVGWQGDTGSADPFYPAAVELVRKYGRGSTSYVQRHLRIGYNRAEYMLDAMEKAGIITPWGPGGTGRDVVPAPVVERKRADDTEGGAA